MVRGGREPVNPKPWPTSLYFFSKIILILMADTWGLIEVSVTCFSPLAHTLSFSVCRPFTSLCLAPSTCLWGTTRIWKLSYSELPIGVELQAQESKTPTASNWKGSFYSPELPMPRGNGNPRMCLCQAASTSCPPHTTPPPHTHTLPFFPETLPKKNTTPCRQTLILHSASGTQPWFCI